MHICCHSSHSRMLLWHKYMVTPKCEINECEKRKRRTSFSNLEMLVKAQGALPKSSFFIRQWNLFQKSKKECSWLSNSSWTQWQLWIWITLVTFVRWMMLPNSWTYKTKMEWHLCVLKNSCSSHAVSKQKKTIIECLLWTYIILSPTRSSELATKSSISAKLTCKEKEIENKQDEFSMVC